MAALVVEREAVRRAESPRHRGKRDGDDGVLPSAIDCRGRPLATETAATAIWRKVSLDGLFALVSRSRSGGQS